MIAWKGPEHLIALESGKLGSAIVAVRAWIISQANGWVAPFLRVFRCLFDRCASGNASNPDGEDQNEATSGDWYNHGGDPAGSSERGSIRQSPDPLIGAAA
jgi:hypothetical protein